MLKLHSNQDIFPSTKSKVEPQSLSQVTLTLEDIILLTL